MKHIYKALFNDEKPVKDPVQAKYGNYSNIELHISKNSIMIVACTAANKDTDSILRGEDELFADAVRKSFLIYMLRYGCEPSVKKARVNVDGVDKAVVTIAKGDAPLIYSMLQGRACVPFDKAEFDKPEIIDLIATTSKSRYDERFNALFSLLTAKAKAYEIERFTYYWMAMNALYNYVSEKGFKRLWPNDKKQNFEKEWKRQNFLLHCYGRVPFSFGKTSDENQLQERRVYWEMMSLLKTATEEEIVNAYACCRNGTDTAFTRKIADTISELNRNHGYNLEIDVLTLLLMWIPYKLRCGSFHGEKNIPFLCFGGDRELKAIHAVNVLLDAFLSEELPVWLLYNDNSSEPICEAMLQKGINNKAYK